MCCTRKGCSSNTLRSKDKGEFSSSKTSNHLFIQALDKGRQRGTESTRILLPALGEQQEEEPCMQIRAKVTLREFKQLHICTCVYIHCIYIYIHSCLYLYTKGTKQPSEINPQCERPREKEWGNAFQRMLSKSQSLGGLRESALREKSSLLTEWRKRDCELKISLL